LDLDGLEGEDLFNRVNETVDETLKGNPSQNQIDAAYRAREAVEDVRRHEATASELEDFLSEMEKDFTGGYGALVEEAVEGAIEEEDELAEEATDRAADELKELKKLNDEAAKTSVKVDKGKAAAKVEKSLTALAQSIFKKDSKSDSIGDEAEGIAKSVEEYAKEKGVDHKLDAPVREVIDDIKHDEEMLNEIMSEFRGSMDSEDNDFDGKDINGLSVEIGRIASDLTNKFNLLRSMDKVEKRRIDDAVKLKEEKAKLGGGESSGLTENDYNKAAMAISNSGDDVFDDAFAGLSAIVNGKVQGFGSMSAEDITREMAGRYIDALSKDGDNHKEMIDALQKAVDNLPEATKESTGTPQEKIAAIYKDWVEDNVPKWVSNLTDEEAKEYVGLLESARDNGSDEGSDSLSKLEEFEESHKNAKPKKTEAKAESKKEKSEAPKQNSDELRKAAIQASRRLGVEAYKPDDVLEKMLETAKAHISDPRQAQRVKDIEAILADRKAKGNKEVSQAEINSSRAERRFKDRTSDAGILPSESFKNMKRDYSEGVGNQENDDWEPSKEEIKAEDEMPKKSREKNAEIVAQMIVQALEGDKE
jgi:hypothetical protein